MNWRERIAFLHPAWFLAGALAPGLGLLIVSWSTGLLDGHYVGIPVTWPVAWTVGAGFLLTLALPLSVAHGIVLAHRRTGGVSIHRAWLFPLAEVGIVALAVAGPVLMMTPPDVLASLGVLPNLLGGAILVTWLVGLWRGAAALNRFDGQGEDTLAVFLGLYLWPIGLWLLRPRLLALRDAATPSGTPGSPPSR